jgi:hypothetical protein
LELIKLENKGYANQQLDITKKSTCQMLHLAVSFLITFDISFLRDRLLNSNSWNCCR